MKLIIIFLMFTVGAFSLLDKDYEDYGNPPAYDHISIYQHWKAVLSTKRPNSVKTIFDHLLHRLGNDAHIYENFNISYHDVVQSIKDFKSKKSSYWLKLNRYSAYHIDEHVQQADDRILDDVPPIFHPEGQFQKLIEKEQFGLNFSYESVKVIPFEFSDEVVIPKEVDWRYRDVLHEIPDYHPNCNVSYPWAVAQTIDAHLSIDKEHETVHTSRQAYLDCIYLNDGVYYKYHPCTNPRFGVNGPPDSVVRAYKFAILNGLMEYEKYEDNDGKDEICLFDKGSVDGKLKIAGMVMLPKGEEGDIALMIALAHYGPVTISIEAFIEPLFYRYGGGIYDLSCHAGKVLTMVVIGYGEDEETGKKFWLVMNNWGNWGQFGYIKIARHETVYKACSLTSQAIFPLKQLPFRPPAEVAKSPAYWKSYEEARRQSVLNKYSWKYKSREGKSYEAPWEIPDLRLPNSPSIWGTAYE